MDEEHLMQRLWEYYTAAAEIQGRRGTGETEDGERQYAQSNFSLRWFFQHDPAQLPPIDRAFLDDAAAMEALAWDEAPPEAWDTFALEGPPLNSSQAGAIHSALAAPVSFIQGPPGTGKTETILNLACCAARLGEGRSVAIISSNNSALDNVRTKIEKFDGTLPNQRWLQQHFARLGSAAKRKKFQDLRLEEPVFRFSGCAVNIPTDCGPVSVRRERNIRAETFLRKYPIITSTIHSLKNCFQNGPDYCYDYVIMDESSQTDIVAGLVAMSCAKHLVLVGDPKQLPPVVNDVHVREIRQRAEEQGLAIPEKYAITPERSFLDVCLDVFGDRMARTTLCCHYRCHPGIIGFCAREIYQEEKLEICTPHWDRSVRIPIKVLWFEGDYCERCALSEEENKKVRYSKRNRKQVRCFMEEEWSQLWERLQGPEPPSVCILSPFKGQLVALRDAIRQELAVQGRDEGEMELALEAADAEQGETVQEPPMLTIHKSQGREFDIVYLLPVEDGDWEWPWSQQKRLVNVAVSRAKRELRLILSSVLMDEEMQQELTGRPVLPKDTAQDPDRAADQRYLQKLVRYVREENEDLKRETGVVGYPASTYAYGFHRSARASVFDLKPWNKADLQERTGNQEGKIDTTAVAWSPEVCAEAALVKLMQKFREERGITLSLYKHVLLKDLRDKNGYPPALPEEDAPLRRLAHESGHLDFALCLGDRLLMALEVDGGYHRAPGREGAGQRDWDEVKNRLFRDVLGAACFMGNAREGQGEAADGSFVFIRLPDDGSTCLETRDLWEAADQAVQELYFPLEELLEAQLEKAEASPAYRVPNRSITSLAFEWDTPDGQGPRPTQANRKLLEEGLITRHHSPVLGGEALMPTEKGRKAGIIEAVMIDRNGGFYGNALYPESVQRMVLKLLNGYQPLLAGLAVCDLLSEVYHPFHAYIDSPENSGDPAGALARLNDAISFQNDRMDYTNTPAQAIYILRYLYGYAYEYKRMYLELLDREPQSGAPLSVTSIGCGNMVDYWSLRAALRERPETPGAVDYTGVDINGWSRRFHIRAASGDRAKFVQMDAVAYLKEPDRAASDVYIFPKSIGEFDGRNTVGGEVLTGIRDGLRDVLRASDKERVWLLISLPQSPYEDYAEKDRGKCAFLRKGLEEAGFVTADPVDAFFTTPEDQRGTITRADSSFFYPRHILNKFNSFGNCAENRSPMLNTGYERCQVLLFQRKR